jgi:hypothetical protein
MRGREENLYIRDSSVTIRSVHVANHLDTSSVKGRHVCSPVAVRIGEWSAVRIDDSDDSYSFIKVQKEERVEEEGREGVMGYKLR